LDVIRDRKWQEAGENCIKRSFVLVASPITIKVINSKRMGGYVARMATTRNRCRILIGKPDGIVHERPRRRW